MSVFTGRSKFAHLSLTDFWRIPTLPPDFPARGSPEEQNITIDDLPNGTARVKLSATRLGDNFQVRTKSEILFRIDGGEVLESHSWINDELRRQRFQYAYQEVDKVPFPFVSIDATYLNGELGIFRLLIVRDARFNHELNEDFRLSVPAGTTIADYRRGDVPIRATRVSLPVENVFQWLEDRSGRSKPPH